MPFLFFGVKPTRIDYRKKGTLILTTLLEDLDMFEPRVNILVYKPLASSIGLLVVFSIACFWLLPPVLFKGDALFVTTGHMFICAF